MFSKGIIFQSEASTTTKSEPVSDAIAISSTSSLLSTLLKYPDILPDDLALFNSSIVLQIIISASSDSKIVLKFLPDTNFGSTLRNVISFNLDRKSSNSDFETVGLIISSLLIFLNHSYCLFCTFTL